MLLGVAMLAGCAGPGPAPDRPGLGVLRVSDPAAPLAYFEGARARRLADEICGPRGVRSSIDDRFEDGSWIFVRGCA
jgi:hypothetical protein